MGISIDQLSSEIQKALDEYGDATGANVKKVSRKVANQVRDDIKSGAPVRTGKYAASWSVKTVSESSTGVNLVVHSRNRYQLAHLLEFGHAKRGGGRVNAIPHIASAEQSGIKALEDGIRKELEG